MSSSKADKRTTVQRPHDLLRQAQSSRSNLWAYRPDPKATKPGRQAVCEADSSWADRSDSQAGLSRRGAPHGHRRSGCTCRRAHSATASGPRI
jgi:hypothetical protein